MTHRSCHLIVALLLAGPLAPGAVAQLKPGVHAARAADAFGGVNGLGASIHLGVPLAPIQFLVAGEYFFPECGGCSFWGGSADIHFSLPIPVMTPYGAAGVVLRHTAVSDTEVRTGGIGIGAGVNLNALALAAFAEGRYEIMDGGVDQLVFRLGIRF